MIKLETNDCRDDDGNPLATKDLGREWEHFWVNHIIRITLIIIPKLYDSFRNSSSKNEEYC